MRNDKTIFTDHQRKEEDEVERRAIAYAFNRYAILGAGVGSICKERKGKEEK